MKDCKYFSNIDFYGSPAELCRLMPKLVDASNSYYKLISCDDIEDCPYKKLAKGLITQEQCDEEVAKRDFMAVKKIMFMQ